MKTIPCPDCGEEVILDEAPDVEEGQDTGQWYHFCCICGGEGFITERDYEQWMQRKKRRSAGTV